MDFFYITNDSQEASIAQKAGVSHIFIDLEVNGKEERQKNMDTVKSSHEIEDIIAIKEIATTSKILVRVNPIYFDSMCEINKAIDFGANVIMLPYFKTTEEVKKFIDIVGKRAETILLLETKQSVEILDEICKIEGIDRIHIGLNDLSLSLKKSFMFELISDGTVEKISNKLKTYNIPFGFGGISTLNTGMLPAENILKEHIRLGSNSVILSRSFKKSVINKYGCSNFEEGFKEELSAIENFLEIPIDFNSNDNLSEIDLVIKEIINGKH
ncbi:aldolase/citrate lyase family protein [Enterococcus sp. RIT-PI-f]|uniref:aldolase/citrate lyase family protein n=1 Tax=Enterococcus sp. RIT-PI-f TaxID=1690244 RepID=UPI0006B96230|nr:aldolase/citrate lyase family protein [Enterococcus sp. RIT-PI-f]KPG70214.1 hypothetical protein AEQ18_09955 [Enterococcus sp. RIT-PI-f]